MRSKSNRAGLLLVGAALTGSSAAASPPQSDPSSSIVGTWNGSAPGQGGTVHGSDRYHGDGTYVSVMQLPNGSVQRIWGTYRAEPTGPHDVRIHYQAKGFLPHQICAQAPGFPVRCRANPVPPTLDAVVHFIAPTAFRIGGLTMRREAGAANALLARAVPDRLVLAARAPVQPHMRQPVMPTLHPYATPSGSGSIQALHADDNAQQYRICAVNNGTIAKERDGTVTCVH